MKLYIIRHGETVWNTQGRLQGKADIELNENGIRLAKITGEGMRDISFDLVISSPLKRAVETAKLVCEGKEVPLLTDERIHEITFGEWEGLCCRGDNYQIPSPNFPDFFKDPFSYVPPEGGESIRQVLERTKDFYEELISVPEYQDKTILIAAHGCSSRALLYHMIEGEHSFWLDHVPANCSVTIVDIKEGKCTIEELDKVYYDAGDIVDFYGTGMR